MGKSKAQQRLIENLQDDFAHVLVMIHTLECTFMAKWNQVDSWCMIFIWSHPDSTGFHFCHPFFIRCGARNLGETCPRGGTISQSLTSSTWSTLRRCWPHTKLTWCALHQPLPPRVRRCLTDCHRWRVGWCPKRRRRCSKQQFSLDKEPRFIEPVVPWNQQKSECWRSLVLNLQQMWTCTHSTKILCPQRRKGCQSFRTRRKQSG